MIIQRRTLYTGPTTIYSTQCIQNQDGIDSKNIPNFDQILNQSNWMIPAYFKIRT